MKLLLTICCILAASQAVFCQGLDDELVLCNREMCPKVCPFGQQTDKDGCFICECLDNPCKDFPCVSGQVCDFVKECETHPCTKLDHECKARAPMMPCPVPMCADFCPHGLQTNSQGCETCDCKANACEGVTCPAGHECKVVEKPNYGPNNEFGYNHDCKPTGQDPMTPLDILNNFDELPPLCTYRKKILDMGRPELLLHQTLEDEQISHRTAADVKCDADGGFQPLQCNAAIKLCWCVSDAGRVIPGTIHQSGANNPPSCAPRLTTAVDIQLVLKHSFSSDNMPGEDQVSLAVRTHVSSWMQLDAEFIEIKEVSTGDEEITVALTLHHDGSDGSRSVAYLSEQLRFNLVTGKRDLKVMIQEQTLTPVPERLSMTPRTDSGHTAVTCFGARVWQRHKVAALVAAGLVFLVLAALGLALIKKLTDRKNGSANMRLYDQNLSFSNELYKDSKDSLDKDCLVIEVPEVIKA